MEESLAVGNMTEVVRVGDTVRRTSGPWTPTIHALLHHLRSRGFDTAPQPLGFDEYGRESISLLPGAVATYPLPDYVLRDSTLVDVAMMLHAYHQASVDFALPIGETWQWASHEPREVICHNDFAPYNLMFTDGQLTGVIDFDTASPGPRVWDLAYTAYRFVPLTGPGNPDVVYPGAPEQLRRLALFTASYGAEDIDEGDILGVTIDKLGELVDFIVDSAASGDSAQQAVLDHGDADIYRHDISYLREAQASGRLVH